MRAHDVASSLSNRVNELEERLVGIEERFDDSIEAMIKPHLTMYVQPDGMRPGNANVNREITVWCQKCSTPWPCRTINELSELYGRVREWPAAEVPFPPVKAKRVGDEI